MALTRYQREILGLLAAERIHRQESYLAGGAALTEVTSSPRLSRDIDLFHDTQESLLATWEEDRGILVRSGYALDVRRQLPSFVEALVRKGEAEVLVQWAVDSAFRFFPLVQGEAGLPALHAFDLATNKALALVGRLEPRDWIDLFGCHERIQPLGLLFWAASGKDPGLNPSFIAAEARRSGRYTQGEVDGLAFEGRPPDAAELSRRWRSLLEDAVAMIGLLPSAEVGTCVLDSRGELFRGDPEALAAALRVAGLAYHRGSIRGSLPRFIERG